MHKVLNKRLNFKPNKQEEAFFVWCNDIFLSDAVFVSKSKVSGYGLKSSEFIPKGTCVLNVGHDKWKKFSAESSVNAMKTTNPVFYKSVEDLANRLLANHKKQVDVLVQSTCLSLSIMNMSAASNNPFVDLIKSATFPHKLHQLPHPLLMNPTYLNNYLSNSKTLNDMILRQNTYNFVGMSLFGKNKDIDPNIAKTLIFEFTKAMSLVLSRAVSSPTHPFTMIPLLDLANHGSNGKYNTQHLHNSMNQSFSLMSIKDIEPGEEICISYGVGRDSASFMSIYGFLGEVNNKNDTFNLTIPLDTFKEGQISNIQLSKEKLMKRFSSDTTELIRNVTITSSHMLIKLNIQELINPIYQKKKSATEILEEMMQKQFDSHGNSNGSSNSDKIIDDTATRPIPVKKDMATITKEWKSLIQYIAHKHPHSSSNNNGVEEKISFQDMLKDANSEEAKQYKMKLLRNRSDFNNIYQLLQIIHVARDIVQGTISNLSNNVNSGSGGNIDNNIIGSSNNISPIYLESNDMKLIISYLDQEIEKYVSSEAKLLAYDFNYSPNAINNNNNVEKKSNYQNTIQKAELFLLHLRKLINEVKDQYDLTNSSNNHRVNSSGQHISSTLHEKGPAKDDATTNTIKVETTSSKSASSSTATTTKLEDVIDSIEHEKIQEKENKKYWQWCCANITANDLEMLLTLRSHCVILYDSLK